MTGTAVSVMENKAKNLLTEPLVLLVLFANALPQIGAANAQPECLEGVWGIGSPPKKPRTNASGWKS